jgi:hypothetical protein
MESIALTADLGTISSTLVEAAISSREEMATTRSEEARGATGLTEMATTTGSLAAGVAAISSSEAPATTGSAVLPARATPSASST